MPPTATSPVDLAALREQFLLRKDISFLNHGSFGACPRPVFEKYQAWQRELESQPVEFLGRRVVGLLAEARAVLAGFVGTSPDNVVYVPNITWAMNAVANSIKLKQGDEVLGTDLEYGAVERTWRYHCDRQGARYITQSIDLPVTTADAIVDQLWAGVTERTRVIVVSHITSGTALILPVAEICRRARAAGILTAIDGAHAPGQIEVDVEAVGADFYCANCHKWLCSPKGAGFLYATREAQELLDPLVVSWGYKSEHRSSSLFIDHFQQMGTADPAAYLSVPAAIAFQRENDWPSVRAACHTLVGNARDRIGELTGLPPLVPDSTEWWSQMATMPIPPVDGHPLHERLWNEYQIEIPVAGANRHPGVRISIQAYNTQQDVDRLVDALAVLLPSM